MTITVNGELSILRFPQMYICNNNIHVPPFKCHASHDFRVFYQAYIYRISNSINSIERHFQIAENEMVLRLQHIAQFHFNEMIP